MPKVLTSRKIDSRGTATLPGWVTQHLTIIFYLVCVSRMAHGDEPASPRSTSESDDAPQWQRALEEAFPRKAGRFEIRRTDLLVWLMGGRFTGMFSFRLLDPRLWQALSTDWDHMRPRRSGR